MRILAIEGSTSHAGVALAAGSTIVASAQLDGEGVLCKGLVTSISQVLRTAGMNCSGLEAVAVDIGPGSFTGLRIALATAKGLAQALQIPIAGVSSLQACIVASQVHDGIACAILPSWEAQVFAGVYRCRMARIEMVHGDQLIGPEDLAATLKSLGKPLSICGLVSGRVREVLGAVLACDGHFLDPQPPTAAAVAIIAEEKLMREGADSLPELAPAYLRPSYAEVRHPAR